VAINRGTRDGIEIGHVLAVLRPGRASGRHHQPVFKVPMQLPDHRLGLLMVFRPFERVSPTRCCCRSPKASAVGDVVTNPY
jgi:hypothetical protein